MAATSSAFDELDRSVQRWIWDNDWQRLRPLQEQAIPALLSGNDDVILAAPTAAGKTEAAFLPIFSNLTTEPLVKGLGALYISPLKALINDQQQRLSEIGELAEVPVHSWHGDVPADRKRRVREHPSGILLITPESIEALFVIHGASVAPMFSELRFIVIDELHSFLGTERGRQLQSLLNRVELIARRRIPRVGLSATLGDMDLARRFLRDDAGRDVRVISDQADGRELRVLVQGFLAAGAGHGGSGEDEEPEPAVYRRKIVADIYRRMRGSDNLVFANSRSQVEEYADLLRRRCEEERVPREFWPHHGNLGKELREDVEESLRSANRPTTAICTSTLELGIDVGSVKSVGQIGAPFSVAALRQRLGRCGRRSEDPSILLGYSAEQELAPGARLHEDLRQELVQTIAAIELLIDRWFEPPVFGALHLSTLVQQTLSVIAQHGGARADQLWSALCQSGPFALDQQKFGRFLRGLAAEDVIQQVGDGDLILGVRGERIVNHYSFYSAFMTPQEYRLIADGEELGTLPVTYALSEGSHLIFAGKRWLILAIDQGRKVITVKRSGAGRVPIFGGGGGGIHDGVREKMRAVYEGDFVPAFLDQQAKQLLGEGRRCFGELGLQREALVIHHNGSAFFPWAGDRVMQTIVLGLSTLGLKCSTEGVAVVADKTQPSELRQALTDVFAGPNPPDPLFLAAAAPGLQREKHDHLLDPELLAEDFAAAEIDVEGATRKVLSLTGDQPA